MCAVVDVVDTESERERERERERWKLLDVSFICAMSKVLFVFLVFISPAPLALPPSS